MGCSRTVVQGWYWMMAASTTMSGRPIWAKMASRMARTSESSPTSAEKALDFTPISRSSWARASACSRFLWQWRATSAPAWARVRAMTRPSWPDAPVMTASFPVRSMGIIKRSFGWRGFVGDWGLKLYWGGSVCSAAVMPGGARFGVRAWCGRWAVNRARVLALGYGGGF